MIKFEGLENNQAIKIGDSLTVKLGSGEYLVNGQSVKASYNGITLTTSLEVKIEKVVPQIRKVNYYELTDGTKLSPEEYTKITSVNAQYYDGDSDEYIYPDLETEFEIRKELDKLKGVVIHYHDQVIEYEPVEITVVGEMVDTGSDAIESSLSVGHVGYGAEKSPYKVKLQQVAAKAVRKAVEDLNATIEWPSHSGLTYIKVDGQYVMTTFEKRQWCTSSNACRITSSLEDARSIEKSMFNEVYSHIVTKLSPKKLNKDTLGDLYSKVESLRDRAYNLDTKKNSKTTKHSMLTGLNDLLKLLQDEV